MSAVRELDEYISLHDGINELSLVCERKLNRSDKELPKAPRFNRAIPTHSNIENDFQYFLAQLKQAKQSRLQQLQQATALYSMDLDINDQLNLDIATTDELNKQCSEEEFEAFLLGEKEIDPQFFFENVSSDECGFRRAPAVRTGITAVDDQHIPYARDNVDWEATDILLSSKSAVAGMGSVLNVSNASNGWLGADLGPDLDVTRMLESTRANRNHKIQHLRKLLNSTLGSYTNRSEVRIRSGVCSSSKHSSRVDRNHIETPMGGLPPRNISPPPPPPPPPPPLPFLSTSTALAAKSHSSSSSSNIDGCSGNGREDRLPVMASPVMALPPSQLQKAPSLDTANQNHFFCPTIPASSSSPFPPLPRSSSSDGRSSQSALSQPASSQAAPSQSASSQAAPSAAPSADPSAAPSAAPSSEGIGLAGSGAFQRMRNGVRQSVSLCALRRSAVDLQGIAAAQGDSAAAIPTPAVAKTWSTSSGRCINPTPIDLANRSPDSSPSSIHSRCASDDDCSRANVRSLDSMDAFVRDAFAGRLP